MLRHAPIDCDAQEGFLCITIKRAYFCYCGTLQYSALVNSAFTNKFNIFFGLNLMFVYKYTICIAWRFHFPLRKEHFKQSRHHSQGNIKWSRSFQRHIWWTIDKIILNYMYMQYLAWITLYNRDFIITVNATGEFVIVTQNQTAVGKRKDKTRS